jgi:hypothetical protein
MKKTRKILVFLCVFVILLCPLSAFAEDTIDVPAEEEIVVPEATPEETPEAATEDSGKFEWGEVKDTVSGYIVNWVQPHLEEISVVVAIIGFIIDNRREKKSMKRIKR